ncbi:MAG TPA: VWA domain-containing protein [Polyangia bacterium]|jgi:Ca-activated chloride channel family protein
MNRKTVLIVSSALALVVIAMVLELRGRAGRATAKPVSTTPALACGGPAAPAEAAQSFGAGVVRATLSGERVLQGSDGQMYLAVELSTGPAATGRRGPLTLAIVIDRSGSMASEEKLARAKDAALGLVERLGDEDQVALVQYDHTAEVVVPLTALNQTGKARLREAVSGLVARGSTNLYQGLQLGRDEVLRGLRQGGVNRVILLTDGLVNTGVTDSTTIAQMAGAAADQQGVRVTTVGLGYQYNEDLLEAIAENGRGSYYYVKDAPALQEVFAGELRAIQGTVGTHAELRLEPRCAGVAVEDVYGYRVRREGGAVIVPLADLAGGDRRKLVARLRVPVGVAGRVNLVAATLSFDDARQGGRRTAALTVGVEVSPDAQAVARAVNKPMVAQALEVEGARAMRRAADAYKRGDVAAANQANRDWSAEAQKQAKKFALPAPAVQRMNQALDSQNADFGRYAPGSAAGQHAVKRQKASSIDMFKK